MTIGTPDSMTMVMVFAIGRSLKGVVDTRNDQEEPGDYREDLVCQEILTRELLSFGKWVV